MHEREVNIDHSILYSEHLNSITRSHEEQSGEEGDNKKLIT